jgi:hypothetical protein
MAFSHQHRRGLRLAAAGTAALLVVSLGVAHAQTSTSSGTQHMVAGEDAGELMDSVNSFDDQRLSPTASVVPGVYGAAWNHVLGMPVARATYSEVTVQPFNSDSLHFRDRTASNSGGGAGASAGRIAALATDPTHPGVVYAGAADGGVFRSSDDGATWTPIADSLPALSVGSLAVASDGSLWLGTGEATTAYENYLGTGVYRLANPATGTFSQSDRVGGSELESTSIHELRFDYDAGHVYTVTSRGVYRRSVSATQTTAWQRVLAPCAGVGISGVACGTSSYYADIANDLAIQPGSHGLKLVANLAWRSGATYNGFYYSNDGGTTWQVANPQGAINPHDIGNSTFAYSADGSRLYVVMESPTLLNKSAGGQSGYTALAGVFASGTGDINGPYAQIATSSALANSGSAMKKTEIGAGYQPGTQAWYDQSLAVDQADPLHVYLGLEEMYETRDGGATWQTTGRYWNLGMSCFSYTPPQNTCDGNVMHSDQHALAFSAWPGRTPEVYVGNDGGAYARSTGQTVGWRDLNAGGTLRSLQFYSVGVGTLPAGGVAVWVACRTTVSHCPHRTARSTPTPTRARPRPSPRT